MRRRLFSFVSGGCVALAVAACGTSNPAQPSSVSATAGATGTASVTTPQPLQPSDAAQVAYTSQPVTLSVKNAVTTGSGAVTYTFEIATDSGFASKVQTKADVAAGGNGQTSVTLDTLTGGSDYYWHARVQQDGTTGVFGTTRKFSVGPQV
ncbi:MAG: hypothetical protein KGN76_06660, partial [Acidobacteriota bacterium]|nr:hypothetical protein [Acidobacteriota bacterium]